MSAQALTEWPRVDGDQQVTSITVVLVSFGPHSATDDLRRKILADFGADQGGQEFMGSTAGGSR